MIASGAINSSAADKFPLLQNSSTNRRTKALFASVDITVPPCYRQATRGRQGRMRCSVTKEQVESWEHAPYSSIIHLGSSAVGTRDSALGQYFSNNACSPSR